VFNDVLPLFNNLVYSLSCISVISVNRSQELFPVGVMHVL